MRLPYSSIRYKIVNMRRINWQNPKHQVRAVISVCMALYVYFTAQQEMSLDDLFKSLSALAFLDMSLIAPGIKALLIDFFVIFIGLSYVLIAFFSQFVLPVRTIDERRNVIDRLLKTISRNSGPALSVQNGVTIESAGESQRGGPGVMLLDSASAAVLHNNSGFTRAVGPGLVFTEKEEKIVDTIDLHVQIRKIGPLDTDKDPELAEEASEEEKNIWAERRLQTRALTRDGVEVIPNISTTFRLNGKAGDGNTEFGYNEDAVWRAVAHYAIDPKIPMDAASRQIKWDWLPVQIAADLWREHLRKYTLNELFELIKSPVFNDKGEELEERPTVFEYIVQQINSRMKKALVTEIDEVGIPTNRKKSSREHQLLLERGLLIEGVNINNLRFKQDPIEIYLLKRWKNTWLERAKEQEKHLDKLHKIAQANGEQEAHHEFTAIIGRPLYRRIIRRPTTKIPAPNKADTLELLIQGTLDYIHSDPDNSQKFAIIESDLIEIQDWLRLFRNDRTNGNPGK